VARLLKAAMAFGRSMDGNEDDQEEAAPELKQAALAYYDAQKRNRSGA
jgi:hypothetical protein